MLLRELFKSYSGYNDYLFLTNKEFDYLGTNSSFCSEVKKIKTHFWVYGDDRVFLGTMLLALWLSHSKL